MLDALKPQPADKILALIAMYRDDTRTDKIDLGVGVYKDPTGLTPVMRAVKAAEKRIWEAETTKTYTGLAGEPAFNQAMRKLILDGAVADDRLASVATPGGTGAVRQALELVKMASPGATSRTVSKPMASRATLSEASMYSTWPCSSARRPRISGRMPLGSRKPMRPWPITSETTA